jgi:hypothetical protein
MFQPFRNPHSEIHNRSDGRKIQRNEWAARPSRELVSLTASSCGFLGFLTLSPLSVKSMQPYSDTDLDPYSLFPISLFDPCVE